MNCTVSPAPSAVTRTADINANPQVVTVYVKRAISRFIRYIWLITQHYLRLRNHDRVLPQRLDVFSLITF